MKKRDIFIYVGVFLLVVGILPILGVDWGRTIGLVANVLIAVCGLIVLTNR